MIIKVIKPKLNQKDNYRQLAQYVALGLSHDGNEKVSDYWVRNCYNNDPLDLDMCIEEINTTRDMNIRANHRSQHIVVSFAKNEYPNKSILQDIEKNIVKTLGYKNHQYIVGIHNDKTHYHIHLAINQIDPQSFKKHIPAFPYKKLSSLAKELEKKHGLYKINSRHHKSKDKNYERQHTQSQDFKAHTWQQPFIDYCKELKPSIDKDIRQAKNWQDVHQIFADHNLQLKRRGNGLVITQLRLSKEYKKHIYIKVSDLGREYSLKSLEKTYGAFEPIKDDLQTDKASNQPKQYKAQPYIAKPLTPNKKLLKQHQQLWNQFIQKKSPIKSKPSGLFANWKQYLFMMSQVGNDPHAMAIVASMQLMFDNMSVQNKSSITKNQQQKKQKNSGLEI